MTPPNCRLFLVAPLGLEPTAAAACLTAALAAGDVASLLLPCERELVNELMPIAHAQDVAVLVRDDARFARSVSADGVQIAAAIEDFAGARASVGPDGIVGVACGSDRHAAMELAEAGADYVVLDIDSQLQSGEPLITWWSDVMEVPCIAAGSVEPDDVAAVAGLGADFIEPSGSMWTSPDAAREVVAAAMKALSDEDPAQ